jgi:sugar phosphate isomerase/epimerase
MFVLSSSCLYRHGLNRVFEFAAQVGFDGVEIVMNDVFDTHDASYIKLLIDSFKMPVVSVSYLHPQRDSHIREAIALAEELGAQVVVATMPKFSDVAFTKWFKDNMKALQEKSRVKIAVENPPHGGGMLMPKYAMTNINELKRFQEISLNTSNLVSNKEDLMRTYGNVKPRLSCIRLSNYSDLHENFLLEKGILPVESLITAVKKDDLKIPVILTVHARLLSSHSKDEVLDRLKTQKEFFDRYYL